MTTIKRKLVFILYLSVVLLLFSCNKKKEFLDEKPDSEVFVPKTISDLQSLLDKDKIINEIPEIGTLSSDEYYMMEGFWETLTSKEKNSYIWKSDIFEGQEKIQDWNMPYTQVLYANIVLEQLDNNVVIGASQNDLDNVRGAALFVRAFAFFNVAQHFAAMPDGQEEGTLGIPLKLTAAIDEVVTRPSLKQTYDKITADLKSAAQLLPDSLPVLYRNRPCKAAVFSALARIYLSRRTYDKAEDYADSCLKYYSRLIDYNTINPNSFLPFGLLNDETIYQGNLLTSSRVLTGIGTPSCVIDSVLYSSYEANDLRKPIFFTMNGAGLPNFRGGYTGTILSFGGLAVDEVMLIKAECLAREGATDESMEYLNTLLKNRWRRNFFVERTANSPADALKIILEERRKELVFRGVRWTDLKRLNKEGAGIVLTRRLNGVDYKLEPNDPKYILPIPPDVINLTGIAQNQR